ncbi:unnamed protein product [Hymenolepis diminuta]|uniref:C2H2-type domain-containing protein n=1 Tax=Hymenolepis diminuta TaxID=6216 RepID=A0A0R3SAC2_HYMDI|nr:unnamed protein product [Hymenolepis diminuta]
MNRSYRRGIVSNVPLVLAGSEIGIVSSWLFCFKCFFCNLIEPGSENEKSPLLMVNSHGGIKALNPEEYATNQKDSEQWMNEIRPAQNWMEQNIVILPEIDCLQPAESNTNVAIMCGRHGHQDINVQRLRFVALRDIYFGSELLAWPDILFGLSIGVPFLIPQNIKSPTRYSCLECGMDFSQPNCLKSHLLLRSESCAEGRRKNTCPFCGRYYARRYSLKIHERMHTGLKPLKCKICDRKFADPSNLNKHLRTHGIGGTMETKTGLKNPYVCKICDKICIRRRDFDRHMRRNHGLE